MHPPFRFTIRRRLLALSLAGLAFTMLMGAVGLWAVHRLSLARDAITDGLVALKSQMEADMMHDALRADVLAAMLAGKRRDDAGMQDARQGLDEHGRQFREALDALASSSLDAGSRAEAQRLRPALDDYLASARSVVEAAAQDTAAAESRWPAFQAAFKRLEDEMGRLGDRVEQDAQVHRRESDALGDAAVHGLVGATVAAAVVLVLLGTVIARSVARPLQQAVQVARAVAAGDLGTRVPDGRGDEIGELLAALNTMSENLARVVGSVRAGSEQLATGTGEIVGANADLCRRTETQAAALQQTAASVEQISGTVDHSAETARQAAALAGQASEAAAAGQGQVDRVVQTMHRIHAGSRRIGEIIATIDGIAFQTNILALNAAVEAARAGEHGRGFAVVAGEVRALAQRAGTAAGEIRTLVGTGVDDAEAGWQLAGEAGTAIAGLVAQVQQVSRLIGEISIASGEQSSGFHQINQAIVSLDHTTQQNAAFVEQTSAAAESLRVQTRSLVDAVSVFRLAPG